MGELRLQIPDSQWKYGEWIEYIIQNKHTVFESKKDRNLKVYYVHCTDEARDKLRAESEDRGEFNVITMGYEEGVTKAKREIQYWMHEKEPGLLMFFTASTREGYEKTLKDKIEQSRGLHEMWIKPDTFERIMNYLITKKECGISKFIASRTKEDIQAHRVPEEAQRRVQYKTSNFRDGINRLEDFKQNLGVKPHSINYVFHGQTVQITDMGMFHLKTVTRATFDLVADVIEMVRDEERHMREFAQALKFTTTSKDEHRFESVLEAGRIGLSIELDINAAREMVTKFQKYFAIINPNIERDGELMFYSTVIDRQKGTVFNISANKNSIVLVPKSRITFETFIAFYKLVVELIDPSASWAKLSEIVEPNR